MSDLWDVMPPEEQAKKVQKYLRSLPPEKRLEGLSAEDRLRGLSPEELEQLVKATIQEVGATSKKDMGKVIAAAKAKLAGKTIDGGRLSQLVKERLSGK